MLRFEFAVPCLGILHREDLTYDVREILTHVVPEPGSNALPLVYLATSVVYDPTEDGRRCRIAARLLSPSRQQIGRPREVVLSLVAPVREALGRRIVPISFEGRHCPVEGIYQFFVTLDDRPVARVPLEVQFAAPAPPESG